MYASKSSSYSFVYFRADVFYPDGYSINDVVKEMKSVEEHLAKQPEVKKVSITFGSTPLRYYLASTSVGPKPNFANVLVELTDSKYTKEYEEDFDAYMKANYPNAITRTSLFKLSPAVDAAIEIGFIGPNVDTLVALTNQALEIMHRNPVVILHIRGEIKFLYGSLYIVPNGRNR